MFSHFSRDKKIKLADLRKLSTAINQHTNCQVIHSETLSPSEALTLPFLHLE
jgi:hypothetical protein